ncbi:MAG TPA: enoyl-CoA hydratase/isomerase family protein, partial [Burkholderiaceae bacterium]|nr:enoyl-CoA hydratase/isomerase family protein [Burkholderiaceae bacterium]
MPAESDAALRIDRRDDVTRLTLNRPHKANALGPDLVDALLAAVGAAAADGTRMLVLAGEGRHFCAGFDLSDLDQQSDGDLLLRFVRVEQLLQAIHDAPFATVALVQGRAMGAGADLVVACSVRIGASDAAFAFPGVRFGLVLGTRRLARRVGDDAARRIVTGGATLDADAALACGLLTGRAEIAEWPQRLEQEAAGFRRLDPATLARVLRCTRSDSNAQDMADLVASAAAPGLRRRIDAYV